jgi:hypothetical protein
MAAEAPVEPEQPHPHHVHWYALMGALLAVAAIGGVITGFQKPATGPFLWATYPSTILAYVCIVAAAVCFLGAIRGRRFPLTKRPTMKIHETKAHEQPYNMDGFNKLSDVTRPSYGVPNVFASEPELLEESDAKPYEPPAVPLLTILTRLLTDGENHLRDYEHCISTSTLYEDDEERFVQAWRFVVKSTARAREWLQFATNSVAEAMGDESALLFRSHAHLSLNRQMPDSIKGQTERELWNDMAGRIQWLAQEAEKLR